MERTALIHRIFFFFLFLGQMADLYALEIKLNSKLLSPQLQRSVECLKKKNRNENKMLFQSAVGRASAVHEQ